jgi:hypothetical protein
MAMSCHGHGHGHVIIKTGLNLKNNIKDSFDKFHPANRDFIKQQVSFALHASIRPSIHPSIRQY